MFKMLRDDPKFWFSYFLGVNEVKFQIYFIPNPKPKSFP